MDEADCADKQTEAFLKYSAMKKKPEGPEATGQCLQCGENVAAPRRWCNADCRDEYEYVIGRRHGPT